jgi:hypothetical protein
MSDQNKTIKHPLERYKRIADQTIRQQCIDNFDENHYSYFKYIDKGSVQDAINCGFNWVNSIQGGEYWVSVVRMLLKKDITILPEPIEEPLNEPKLMVGVNTYSTVLEMMVEEQKQKNDQLRSEKEKLRECLYDILESMLIAGTEKEEEVKQLLNK